MMILDDPISVLIGSGSAGVLGFIGGLLQSRFSAEGRYNTRVDERLKELESAVEECRKRDGHLQILILGLKMIVPEMRRKDPHNPILGHVCVALSALPSEDGTFDELLRHLQQVEAERLNDAQSN